MSSNAYTNVRVTWPRRDRIIVASEIVGRQAGAQLQTRHPALTRLKSPAVAFPGEPDMFPANRMQGGRTKLNGAGPITGGCYCGSVRFRIAAATVPVLAGYCHCTDCRRAHAAPVNHYAYVDPTAFEITAGPSELIRFSRQDGGGPERYFCGQCGTRLYSMIEQSDGVERRSLLGSYPALFDDRSKAAHPDWIARKHIHCKEAIFDIDRLRDRLPRWEGDSTLDASCAPARKKPGD